MLFGGLLTLSMTMFMVACEEEEQPTCDDGIMNGTETAIDCGGECTPCYTCGTAIQDVEGNSYGTVAIGDQCWMKENLNTSKYSDGTSIPNPGVFTQGEQPGWWYYDYAETFGGTYGKLYNGYAMESDAGLCPEGWHIPTMEDWRELFASLGDTLVAGGKMKSTGVLWDAPNAGASNSSGFTALPGGYASSFDGYCFDEGAQANFWSSTTVVAEAGTSGVFLPYPVVVKLTYNTSRVETFLGGYPAGYSCRCVMD